MVGAGRDVRLRRLRHRQRGHRRLTTWWSTSRARRPTARPARPTRPSPPKPWWTSSPRSSGIDPIEFRLKNAAKEGTRRADGPKYKRIGCVEVLEAMKNHPHYNAPLEGPNRGRGVAVGFWFNVGPAVELHAQRQCRRHGEPGGRLDRYRRHAHLDRHAGGRSARAFRPKTCARPWPTPIRSAIRRSPAAAARPLPPAGRPTKPRRTSIRQMKRARAKLWESRRGSSDASSDGVFRSGEPIDHLPGTGGEAGLRPAARSWAAPPSTRAASADRSPAASRTWKWIRKPARSTILRFTAVQDAGKAIHPSYVEGQMQGGSVQGIGWALNEEYYMSPRGRAC